MVSLKEKNKTKENVCAPHFPGLFCPFKMDYLCMRMRAARFNFKFYTCSYCLYIFFGMEILHCFHNKQR